MAPYDLESYGTADLHDVLSKLTVAEKISLLAGPDWWTTTPLPRVGVPHIKCSDGPNGVRGSSHFLVNGFPYFMLRHQQVNSLLQPNVFHVQPPSEQHLTSV